MIGYVIAASVAAIAVIGWLWGRMDEQNSFQHKRGTGLRHGEMNRVRDPIPPSLPKRRPVQRTSGIRYPWTREQDLAVLYVQQLQARGEPVNQAVRELAWAMYRTDEAVWMRIANFDFLDSSVASSGLSHAAQLTREIWMDFQRDPDKMSAAALRAYARLVGEKLGEV